MSIELKPLEWHDEITVVLDSGVMFGKGYDYFGLENLSIEAVGIEGKFRLWPSGNYWYLYHTVDGGLASYDSLEEAKEAANRWNHE